MALRLSIEEALKRGYISKDDKNIFPRASSKRSSRNQPLLVSPIDGNTPQERLWRKIITKWPGLAKWEYKGAVPGRRFRIDIALPQHRLAIEFDGYQFHGRFKKPFQLDRERQNLLTAHGWQILRYYYKEVQDDLDGVIKQIETVLKQIEKTKKLHKECA